MMKNLRILIVAVLSVVASQVVLAVTLPGTSYTPYASGEDSYSSTDESVYGSGSLTQGSYFEQLGASEYSECTELATFSACEQCCSNLVLKCYELGKPRSECEELSSNCNNSCGRSLPLSAPLWFALLLPLLAGALKPLLSRRQA